MRTMMAFDFLLMQKAKNGDSGTTKYMERIANTLAVVFVMLIIPEIWKTRKYSAMEI